MSRASQFTRHVRAGSYLDGFLVSAVGAILVIRFYLHVTGYPQIGGGTLHIAHMLWGGLLMLAAIAILFSFLSASAVRLAVFLGGIGFGTFIDEVGKFVTQDNDYFFQPSVAIMYGTFVVFYLAGRLILGWRDYTQTEYLANALNEMQELAGDRLDEEERKRAQAYLSRSDPHHPLTVSLQRVLADASLVPASQPGRLVRVRDWLQQTYLRVVDLPGFATLLILFFAGQLVVKLGYLFGLIFLRGLEPEAILDRRVISHLAQRTQGLSFADRAEVLVSFVAALFVLLGILRIRKSRLAAYKLFRTSILINIFLTEIFVFAQKEFGALTGFAFNLLVLLALTYLIDREKLRVSSVSVKASE
jgi:hypothetical protein